MQIAISGGWRLTRIGFGFALPRDVQVYAAIRESIVLLRQRRFAEVVERCGPVLDANPHYVPLRLLVGQALVGMGRELEAEAQLRHCLELDPDCGPAYRYLAEVELRRDRAEAAARLVDRACRLDPSDREARDLRYAIERRLRAVAAPRHSVARDSAGAPPPRRRRPAAAARDPEAGRRKLARGTDTPGSRARRHATLRDDFGDYLAEIGLLSRAQVRAALIYRRTRGVDLGDAAVDLGFVSRDALLRAANGYRGLGGE